MATQTDRFKVVGTQTDQFIEEHSMTKTTHDKEVGMQTNEIKPHSSDVRDESKSLLITEDYLGKTCCVTHT